MATRVAANVLNAFGDDVSYAQFGDHPDLGRLRQLNRRQNKPFQVGGHLWFVGARPNEL